MSETKRWGSEEFKSHDDYIYIIVLFPLSLMLVNS